MTLRRCAHEQRRMVAVLLVPRARISSWWCEACGALGLVELDERTQLEGVRWSMPGAIDTAYRQRKKAYKRGEKR